MKVKYLNVSVKWLLAQWLATNIFSSQQMWVYFFFIHLLFLCSLLFSLWMSQAGFSGGRCWVGVWNVFVRDHCLWKEVGWETGLGKGRNWTEMQVQKKLKPTLEISGIYWVLAKTFVRVFHKFLWKTRTSVLANPILYMCMRAYVYMASNLTYIGLKGLGLHNSAWIHDWT